MSIKASIYHLTHYRYDRPVVLGPQVIRLRPAPHSRTRVLSHSLKVTPVRPLREPPAGPLRQLAVALRLSRAGHRAEDRGRPRRRHDGLQPVRLLRRGRRPSTGRSTTPRTCTTTSSSTAGPSRSARGCRPSSTPSRASGPAPSTSSSASTPGSASEIGYVIRMEPGVQTPEETFERGTGSCRDTSWLLVQILRNLGLAARFVSGYLIQLKPDLVVARRPARHRPRLHRPARLGRGLPARRRLDRPRPDLAAC